MSRPLADPVEEGRRVAGAAAEHDVGLRVAGGVGIALRCPSSRQAPLMRTYADVDLVGLSRQRPSIESLLVELGYVPDVAFNAVHGARRLFFWDERNGRQLDMFLDHVEMCHDISLRHRLTVDETTLSLADLLLMKLQIVETNEKDMLDMTAMFLDQELTEDDSGINVRYLRSLTSSDWGLWKTTTMVAARVDLFARELLEDREHLAKVHARIGDLLLALESTPKSVKWRIRAAVGERVRWYQLPEDPR
jgi:hypothetical protein